MKMRDTARRMSAGVGVVALAAGLTLSGAGFASADSVSSPMESSADMERIVRTVSGDSVSDGKVVAGSEITITNELRRKLAWQVYWVEDNHSECLTPVAGGAKWWPDKNNGPYTNEAGSPKASEIDDTQSGVVKLDAPGANSWAANPFKWEQRYTVDCDPGEVITGGVRWDSTLVGGPRSMDDLGPNLEVIEVAPAAITGLTVT